MRPTPPIPRFITERRVRELGGIRAVAERLGMPERTARDVLMSERPLPPWVLDVLFPGWDEDAPLPPSSPMT